MDHTSTNTLPSNPKTWGRASETTWFSWLSVLLIISTTPFMVLYFYIAVTQFGGSLIAPLQLLWTEGLTWGQIVGWLPSISTQSLAIYGAWVLFQVTLATQLPDVIHRIIPSYHGGQQLGSVTPAGTQLPYQINGLQAWFISNVVFVVAAFGLGWFSPAIIAEHWGGLLWATNILGYIVAIIVYAKAHYAPCNPKDSKWSGSKLYDFYMGIELNPRIGRFDFKLFFNGRPGIAAWTLINISFAAQQYALFGTVTNSILLVNLLQAIYVIDFFWNERWYLKTIDIHHEHFGWMLAWGDCVWLPYMYTLQGFYLAYNPIDLSTAHVAAVLALGLGGYALFRAANAQKDFFRRHDGDVKIWGKSPSFIEAKYRSTDGTERSTKLLTSGWWGMSRHMNYLGDLMLSFAACMACGFHHVLPYFYMVFMTILLVHRCYRDEHRCHHKYGPAWEEYCQQVPYRIIPGIF